MTLATFGGGCFWCLEAAFERLSGVERVVSGYAGGSLANPTYEAVCTGSTGHAEVVQIHFNPEVIDFEKLLAAFFSIHDPTTLNRQGADLGTQYRSVIFCHDKGQKAIAEEYVRRLMASNAFGAAIVTRIEDDSTFYPAEPYHQRYFEQNPGTGYCAFVVSPKVEKFSSLFRELLKPEYR